MNDNQDHDIVTEHILLALQLFTDDIKQIKNRYWIITNYVLLLMAAIVGYTHLLDLDNSKISCSVKGVLLVLSASIAALGSYFLYDF
jgi:hypothetical protein